MLTIYHNPRCSKSRAGLNYLIENNIKHQVIEYLNHPLTAEQIEELSKITGLKGLEMVRTQEEYYKKELKGKQFTEKEWFQIIANNPKLLQRPIVTKGNKGIFAQPPQNIDSLL
jgi:arsenate reductase (glutaredoxin)